MPSSTTPLGYSSSPYQVLRLRTRTHTRNHTENAAAVRSTGKYPVVTVQTILSIAAQAEKVFDYHYHYDHLMEQSVQASLEVPAGQELGASPTGASVSRSVSQSVRWSVSQSVGQSVSLSVSQSVSQSVSLSVSQSVSLRPLVISHRGCHIR